MVGVFSHFANTSRAVDEAQLAVFERALAAAADAGLRPSTRHLASSEQAIRDPRARYDVVRIGIGVYGLTPFGDGTTCTELGLTPAMTLRTRVAAVRRVAEGTGASYAHIWHAERPTTLALVPLGYADGIPRHASGGGAQVLLAGAAAPSSAASPWTSSSSTSATTRSRSATRWSCSATPRPAPRPPTSGPRLPARSATRS